MSEVTKKEVTEQLIVSVLTDMFEADNEYGCGFYTYPPWREAYAKLQKIIGYKGGTAVFDDEFCDFNDLPDA